jgi:DNA invertase Pin-like site-specific DNA recombinase
MDSKVEFVAVDMPEASRLILHIMAAFAEHERDTISKRTKEALAAAKARGTRLGTYGTVLAARNKVAAQERLQGVAELLAELKSDGLSVRQIVSTLNGRGITSPAGGRWHVANAYRALVRLGLHAKEEPIGSAS